MDLAGERALLERLDYLLIDLLPLSLGPADQNDVPGGVGLGLGRINALLTTAAVDGVDVAGDLGRVPVDQLVDGCHHLGGVAGRDVDFLEHLLDQHEGHRPAHDHQRVGAFVGGGAEHVGLHPAGKLVHGLPDHLIEALQNLRGLGVLQRIDLDVHDLGSLIEKSDQRLDLRHHLLRGHHQKLLARVVAGDPYAGLLASLGSRPQGLGDLGGDLARGAQGHFDDPGLDGLGRLGVHLLDSRGDFCL